MSTMRKVKNVVNNYTPAQVKVREATSNDPWGPSSSVMSEIADLTYNVVAFSEIMSMIWKRLNDHGKNWRHVYKALMVLEYIIKTGSERVAQQCKENIFAIQTLKDFQFTDRDGKDQGMNVREKSKNLVLLLKDDERLKTERERALKAKERFAQASQGIGSDVSPTSNAEATDGQSPDQNETSGDGNFKLQPELNGALTERCRPRDNKGLREKHVKSSHEKKRSKSVSKDRSGSKANEEDKLKEPEGIMTSTGAIMIPVTQQYWWKAGGDSDYADSDFDDEIISASSGTPPLQRDLSSEIEQARPQTSGEEELQLQLALAMSREEADEKKKVERSDDVRLQMALSASQPGQPGHVAPAGGGGGASTLLNLAEPQMPGNSDPWGAPPSTELPSSDPWGSGPAHPPASTTNMPAIPNDPWANQSQPAAPPPSTNNDPWAPTATPAAADPWGGSSTSVPPAPQPTSDPWNSTPNPAHPPAPSDPWGSTKPQDPDAEFDMLRTADGSPQPLQPAGDAFNMSGVSNALPPQDPKKKSPKDFLGENSSLVNLDSLITAQPQPAAPAAPANPFMMGTTMSANATSASAANPFHQQRQPAPTINQIRSQPAGGGMMGGEMSAGMGMGVGMGAGGAPLAQPLMPMTMTPLVPQAQPQQQTNNPFLM